jgi:N-acetylglucosaminyldiphosphoundecaprenol N-acetyl-beta-D-mannosaminyltransferase
MKKQPISAPKKDGNTFQIFGTELISSSFGELLGSIEQRTAQGQRTFITTPNPEFIVYAQQHPWFKKLLIQSDMAIPDGVALLWAKEVLKENNLFLRLLVGFLTGLKVVFAGWGEKRITGTDLTEKLCQLAAKNNWTVYFFGGEEKTTPKALKRMQEKYPGLKGWANFGPRLSLNLQKLILEPVLEVKKIVEDINNKQPDFLFVALNMGKQEKFIADHWSQLKIKLGMGIGGAFNYLSGDIKRAPLGIQKTGFEWLYRLYQEPWRWKRQLKLLQFIFLVLKGKTK